MIAWLATLAVALPETPTAAAACLPVLADPVQLAAVAAAYNDEGRVRRLAKDLAGSLAAFRVAAALQPASAEYLNNLAYLYDLNGQPALAEPLYAASLALDAKRTSALVNYAQFLVARAEAGDPGRDPRRDLALAADHLETARATVDADPAIACSQARVAARRGICDEAAGHLGVCRSAWTKRSKKRPLAELGAWLGDCRFQAGQYDAAQLAYATAASQGVDVAQRLRTLAEATARSQVLAGPERQAVVQGARADALRATALLQTGQVPAARALLAKAAIAAPDLGVVALAQAELAVVAGDSALAELAFTRALTLGLDDERWTARAQAGLGHLYLRAAPPRPAEATALLAQAVRREPTLATLRWDLVQAARASGQLRRAQAHLERLLQQPLTDSDRQREALALRRSLADALGPAPTGQTAEALETPAEPTKAPADRVQAARDEAKRLAGEDRYRDAVAVLRRALAADKGASTPRNPSAYNELAVYLHALGDPAAAAQTWRASLRIDDGQAQIHDALARHYLRAERVALARPHLARAESLGLTGAGLQRIRLDLPDMDQGPVAPLGDLLRRGELTGLLTRLERLAQRRPTAAEASAIRALQSELEQRVRAADLLALAVLLGLLALAAWLLQRIWGGAVLRELMARHPETGPEVQRVLAAIRHEVLKHNTLMLSGLCQAIARDEADADAAALHLRESLFGGADPVAARLEGYVSQLEQLGRAQGMRLNLRRRDAAISAILRGFSELERTLPQLARLDRLRPGPRRRLLGHLQRAARLLNSEGYEAVRDLLDSLRMLRVDAALLLAVVERARREPGLRDVQVLPVAIEAVVALPVWVLVPRAALEDILINVVRNALQASRLADSGSGAGVAIGLAIDADVHPITGVEHVLLVVRDAAPGALTAEMLRGRAIEAGLGLAADLVARHDGVLAVREEAAPWRKAVVVRLPRAYPTA